MRNPWMGIGLEMWALGVESASVVGLRSLKLAQGGTAAGKEAELMVAEKMASAFDVQMSLMTGAFGLTPAAATRRTVSHYQRKVSANRRRLSR